MVQYLQFTSDFDEFRYNFNRTWKLQLDHKFVGLSGLINRLGLKAFALFRRAFERALSCANSLLNRTGRCVFRVCGHSLTVYVW